MAFCSLECSPIFFWAPLIVSCLGMPKIWDIENNSPLIFIKRQLVCLGSNISGMYFKCSLFTLFAYTALYKPLLTQSYMIRKVVQLHHSLLLKITLLNENAMRAYCMARLLKYVIFSLIYVLSLSNLHILRDKHTLLLYGQKKTFSFFLQKHLIKHGRLKGLYIFPTSRDINNECHRGICSLY
jgi:hypothetical protein